MVVERSKGRGASDELMRGIKSLGIVGAGQMGRGIAQVAARTGIDVASSTRPDIAQRGVDEI